MDGSGNENSVRKYMVFTDAMKRYKAEIEHYVFAAEILCSSNTEHYTKFCTGNCPFAKGGCTLVQIRAWVGNPH